MLHLTPWSHYHTASGLSLAGDRCGGRGGHSWAHSTCPSHCELFVLFSFFYLFAFEDRTHGIWRFPG